MYTTRDYVVDQLRKYMAAGYILAPEKESSPLTNLGSLASISPAELMLGAALKTPGLLSGGAAALLDGVNDGIDTKLETRRNWCKNPIAQVNTAKVSVSASAGLLEQSLKRVTCTWHKGIDFCFRLSGKQPADTSLRALRLNVVETGLNGAPAKPGDIVTASAYVNTVDPSVPITEGLRWIIVFTDAAGVQLKAETQTPKIADETLVDTRISFTAAAAPAETALVTARLEQLTTTSEDAMAFEVTGILVETSNQAGVQFPNLEQITSGEAGFSGTAHESVSYIGPLAAGTSRTVALMFQPSTEAQEDVIFGGAGGSKGPYLFSAKESPNLRFYDNNVSASFALGAGGAEAGQTHLLVIVREGKLTKLYIDGVLRGEGEGDGWNYAGPLYIGANSATGNAGFGGFLLPFAVCLRALTAAEIRSLYRLISLQRNRLRVHEAGNP